MSKDRILILADDLTGSNDTAIQFAKEGLQALVLLKSEPVNWQSIKKYDCISINFNSRVMSPDDAYKAVYCALKNPELDCKEYFIYKKVDSVLRGNPGKELAAVMDAAGIPLALAAPCFPANKSVIENGMLYSGGNTANGIDAVKVFAGGTGKKTENIPLKTVRQGAEAVGEFIKAHRASGIQVFVPDALSDEDLEIIYKASAFIEGPYVLTGSAGLANQMAKRPGKAKTASVKNNSFSGPVLLVAGTRQGETAAQTEELLKAKQIKAIEFKVDMAANGKSAEAVDLAFKEACQQMKSNNNLCVVIVDSMFKSRIKTGEVAWSSAEGGELGVLISQAMGTLSRKLLDEFGFSVLISTGGDTSMEICNELGVAGIEPLVEISKGIPIGKIIGGDHEGRFIVTKSGRFGDQKTFITILDFLEGKF